MATITAAMVKDLREKTGAGMMDCKAALGEVDGDMEAAVDWLRTKGLAAAAKKSGRVAAEGLVGIVTTPGHAAMVEVNAETDFVARNDRFQAFVETAAQIALSVGEDLDAIKAAPYPGSGRTVADELTHLVATIGENMNLRRARVLSVGGGVVALGPMGQVLPTGEIDPPRVSRGAFVTVEILAVVLIGLAVFLLIGAAKTLRKSRRAPRARSAAHRGVAIFCS